MRERAEAGEAEAWLGAALHDLCQPLTALQCRLALGSLATAGRVGDELTELREAVRDSLVQCERMLKQVRAMQVYLGDREAGE